MWMFMIFRIKQIKINQVTNQFLRVRQPLLTTKTMQRPLVPQVKTVVDHVQHVVFCVLRWTPHRPVLFAIAVTNIGGMNLIMLQNLKKRKLIRISLFFLFLFPGALVTSDQHLVHISENVVEIVMLIATSASHRVVCTSTTMTLSLWPVQITIMMNY